MKLGLAGKGVVITGGSRGIGRACALAFAEEGASVALCARGVAALQRTEAELRALGAKVFAARCDVAEPAELVAFLESAHTALGRIDVLVNNASALSGSDDEDGWRRSVQTDLMASVRAAEQVIPWLEQVGGGCIIHLSSTLGGLEGDAAAPASYAAVKGALVSHAKMLALRLAPRGIRVNCVAPGSIEFEHGLWDELRRSDFAAYERVVATIPSGRMGRPDEVARAVVFLASEAASWITGVTLAVDGGQHRGNL